MRFEVGDKDTGSFAILRRAHEVNAIAASALLHRHFHNLYKALVDVWDNNIKRFWYVNNSLLSIYYTVRTSVS